MDKIKVMLLNDGADFRWNRRLMKLAANMSMHGEKMQEPSDIIKQLDKAPSAQLVQELAGLPHVTLQKFVNFQIVVIGASRRFLAQITRHQNDVKFMSMSLHYSDMSDSALDYVVPSGMDDAAKCLYLDSCAAAKFKYDQLVLGGVPHEQAAYILSQGTRNILMISANAWQWRHMIQQRVCKRNTDEMRYVMLLCWHALYTYGDATLFCKCAPQCLDGKCCEGRLSCGKPFGCDVPAAELEKQFKDMPWDHAVVALPDLI